MFEGIQDFLDELNAESVKLSPADESAILLTALEDVCTPEEFQIINENLTELELYGLIENAQVATEAKKIVYKVTKQMNLNREQAKAALRRAEKRNTAAWKKYAKGRAMMIAAREEIYKQEGSYAKQEAKQIVSGAKKKASSMKNTVTGKIISDKLDAKVREYNKK